MSLCYRKDFSKLPGMMTTQGPVHLRRPPPEGQGGRSSRWVAMGILVVVVVLLLCWGSPPLALFSGLLFALGFGSVLQPYGSKLSKWFLQGSVILLGFGMDLGHVLQLGAKGSLFAAISIGLTLLLGSWLGARLGLDRKTSTLISAGTAICGGSAIAAVSVAIAATEAQIAVSIGTVFILNAVALYLFPLAGTALGLGQEQFGLWAGVAIHDISSVVGAGMSYGAQALETATAIKLSRTLWIIPLSLFFAHGFRVPGGPTGSQEALNGARKRGPSIPWFIGLFLIASLLRTVFPLVRSWAPEFLSIAHQGMIIALFLIGTALTPRSLKTVGWRTLATGVALWLFISLGSLLAIWSLGLSA